MTRKNTEKHFSLLLLLPAFCFIFFMLVFPMIFNLLMGFSNWYLSSPDKPAFIGLQNYIEILLNDPRFWPALFRTFIFTSVGVAIQLILGLVIALILNKDFIGKSFIRTLFLFPMMATPIASALVWRLMFNPSLGILNYLFDLVGLGPYLWTAHPNTALLSIVMVDTWRWTSFMTLLILAGLESLPAEPYEAATIDGASFIQKFYLITLPLVKATLVISVIFRTVDSLKVFDIIFVITGGGPMSSTETLSLYLYKISFEYFHMGYASALVLIFTIIIALCSLALFQLRKRTWQY